MPLDRSRLREGAARGASSPDRGIKSRESTGSFKGQRTEMERSSRSSSSYDDRHSVERVFERSTSVKEKAPSGNSWLENEKRREGYRRDDDWRDDRDYRRRSSYRYDDWRRGRDEPGHFVDPFENRRQQPVRGRRGFTIVFMVMVIILIMIMVVFAYYVVRRA